MFKIKRPYRGQYGEVKFSQGGTGAFLEGRTKGLALKYVSQGRENYSIGGRDIALGAGQFMILEENRNYLAGVQQSGPDTQGICIDLDPGFVLHHIPHFYDSHLLFELPFQAGHFIPLGATFHQFSLDSAVLSQSTDWDAQLPKLGEMLGSFTEFFRDIEAHIGFEAKKPLTQKRLIAKLFRARDFIHQHYKKPLKLKSLSRYAGISQYYFGRLFQSCFQCSPFELQQELRMKAALELMRGEQLSLSDIGFQLGYTDLAAFSNQFKKYHHQSPSTMRKTLGASN